MNYVDFYQKPIAVYDLADNIFLQLPLYKSKNKYTPIFIDNKMYKRYICNKTHTWNEMGSKISEIFSVTINQEQSNSQQIGVAYIDRQEDPLGFSLNGNLGSGRAYYIGSIFNIKGEKTPLATSNNIQYSNGVLDLEKGITETLSANLLKNSINLRSYSILAILKIDSFCYTLNMRMKQYLPCVKIVRIANECTLNRITHAFYMKKKYSKNEIIQSAKAIGTSEAAKFTERILHGAYSAGNISMKGEILDLESINTTNSRVPLYVITNKYIGNFFGFEYKGQIEILKALFNNRKEEHLIEKNLTKSMLSGISKGLIYLMGFKTNNIVLANYSQPLLHITKLFYNLSRYFWDNYSNYYVGNPVNLFIHCYNFSKFFRYYPLLKKYKHFNYDKAFELITETWPLQENIKLLKKITINNADPGLNNTFKQYQKNFIHDENILKLTIYQFIEQYEKLYYKILKHVNNSDWTEPSLRAYIINEDRLYANWVYSINYWLATSYQTMTNERMNQFIHILMLANCRKPIKLLKQKYISDLIVYKEGFSCKLLDTESNYQLFIRLFLDKINIKILDLNKLKIILNGEIIPINIRQISNNYLCIISKSIPTSNLIKNYKLLILNNDKLSIHYMEHRIKLSTLHINFIDQVANVVRS